MDFLTKEEVDQLWSTLFDEPRATNDVFNYKAECHCYFCLVAKSKTNKKKQQDKQEDKQEEKQETITLSLKPVDKENVKYFQASSIIRKGLGHD